LESGSTSICEAAKTFSSSVWLKKNTLKIPIYRYSDGGISVFGICDIDPLYILWIIVQWRNNPTPQFCRSFHQVTCGGGYGIIIVPLVCPTSLTAGELRIYHLFHDIHYCHPPSIAQSTDNITISPIFSQKNIYQNKSVYLAFLFPRERGHIHWMSNDLFSLWNRSLIKS
jgi:hypothetical protein